MFKKLLLTLALLASWPATAQWQVPTNSVPVGRGPGVVGFNSIALGTAGQALTSNGASSPPSFQTITPAIISNLFANPTASVCTTAVNGSALTAMRSDAAPAYNLACSPTMTGNWTFNPASGNAIAINTAAGANQGIVSAQTGTNAGSLSADFSYNSVTILTDGLANTANTYGFLSSLNVVGTNAKGEKYGFRGAVTNTAPSLNTSGDLVGVSGLAIATQPNGGTNTGGGAAGTLYGLEAEGFAASGAINYFVVSGGEFDAIINTGGSAANRWGLSISANGNLPGAGTDAAIETHDATAGGRWNGQFILFRGTPFTSAASVIGADSTSVSMTNFVSLPNYSFSGNLFDFGFPFKVTGPGQMTLNQSGSTLPAASVTGIQVGGSAGNLAGIEVDALANSAQLIGKRTNGTYSLPSGMVAGNVLLNANTLGYNGTTYVTGAAIKYVAGETWSGTASGEYITVSTTPLTTTGVVEAVRFNPSGGVGVGTTVDPGLGALVVNSHILGNGTAPALGACGTSPSIVGSDVAGKITVGSGTVTSCVITFHVTFGVAPACTVSSSTSITSPTVATTTTTMTIGGSSLTSDVIAYHCLSTSWLLKRDLSPFANDNQPAFMEKVA